LLDEEVVVRGRDVHVPRLDRHLVVHVLHRPLDPQVQELGEPAGGRGPMPVLGDHDRYVDLVRDVGEEASDGVQASPRSAYTDQLVQL
jgi:hypothetical protein